MTLPEKLMSIGVVSAFFFGSILIAGWFINIFAIINTVSGGFTTELALRILGVLVAPLGSILGLFL